MVETIWRKPGGGQEHCEASNSCMCFIVKVERTGCVSEQENFDYWEWAEGENTTQNEKGPAILSPGTPMISLANIILLCKPGNWHCQKKWSEPIQTLVQIPILFPNLLNFEN